MDTPENVISLIAALCRVSAAHFEDPETALAFARLCDEEAGRAGRPLGRNPSGDPAPQRVAREFVWAPVQWREAAFEKEPFKGWRHG